MPGNFKLNPRYVNSLELIAVLVMLFQGSGNSATYGMQGRNAHNAAPISLESERACGFHAQTNDGMACRLSAFGRLFLFFRSELILLFLISLPDKLPAGSRGDCIKDTGEGDAKKSHETV